MDALLMCGGRGTRLGGEEKPLRRIGGRTLVDRVRGALEASRIERTYAVTSPNAPRTADAVAPPTIGTPGEGYVADLRAALADDRVTEPVVTAAADLPLLDGAIVDRVLDVAAGDTLTAAVPAGYVAGLGYSVDTTVRADGILVRPAGLNVVGPGSERVWVTRDRRLAANVNRPRDLETAAWQLAGQNPSFREPKR